MVIEILKSTIVMSNITPAFTKLFTLFSVKSSLSFERDERLTGIHFILNSSAFVLVRGVKNHKSQYVIIEGRGVKNEAINSILTSQGSIQK